MSPYQANTGRLARPVGKSAQSVVDHRNRLNQRRIGAFGDREERTAERQHARSVGRGAFREQQQIVAGSKPLAQHIALATGRVALARDEHGAAEPRDRCRRTASAPPRPWTRSRRRAARRAPVHRATTNGWRRTPPAGRRPIRRQRRSPAPEVRAGGRQRTSRSGRTPPSGARAAPGTPPGSACRTASTATRPRRGARPAAGAAAPGRRRRSAGRAASPDTSSRASTGRRAARRRGRREVPLMVRRDSSLTVS